MGQTQYYSGHHSTQLWWLISPHCDFNVLSHNSNHSRAEDAKQNRYASSVLDHRYLPKTIRTAVAPILIECQSSVNLFVSVFVK